jgi:simple sugar transport system permease protein
MSSEVKQLTPKADLPTPGLKRQLQSFLRKNGTQLGILAVFALMWISFILAAPRTFMSPQIYAAFMATIPFFALMALPLTMVVIAGEMDLSFPSIMAMAMVGYILTYDSTQNVTLAVLVGIVIGFLVGLSNGFIVVKFGIPSLVATIGTSYFWRGATLVILNGKGATLVPAKSTFIYNLFVGKTFGYIPNQMIWLVVIGVVTWVLLNRHRFGAHVYLIGDNENSARLMGINVGRTRMMAFALVGLVSGLAGIMASMQVAYFWPSLGEGYLLKTLSSVFLGGTSVFGGVGTVLGTFIGAFIIGAIEAAIVAIGLTGYWTQLIYGLIIILSVTMHSVLRKRMK